MAMAYVGIAERLLFRNHYGGRKGFPILGCCSRGEPKRLDDDLLSRKEGFVWYTFPSRKQTGGGFVLLFFQTSCQAYPVHLGLVDLLDEQGVVSSIKGFPLHEFPVWRGK